MWPASEKKWKARSWLFWKVTELAKYQSVGRVGGEGVGEGGLGQEQERARFSETQARVQCQLCGHRHENFFYDRFRLKKYIQLDMCKPATKARPHLNIKNKRRKNTYFLLFAWTKTKRQTDPTVAVNILKSIGLV